MAECALCHSLHSSFYCKSCLNQGLQSYVQQYSNLSSTKIKYVDKVGKVLGVDSSSNDVESQSVELKGRKNEKEMSSLYTFLVQRDSKTLKVQELEDILRNQKLELQKERDRILSLRHTIQSKRKSLSAIKPTFDLESATLSKNLDNSISELQHKLGQLNTAVTTARKVLVKELCKVFNLRAMEKVVNGNDDGKLAKGKSKRNNDPRDKRIEEDAKGKVELEYYIQNVTIPSNGDYLNYPRDKLNAAIGYAVHMLNLLALYLGIHLPFQLIYLGSKSYAKINYAKSIGDPTSQLPLYLTEDNFESFLFALAMLNYNVAYLCHTQGIEIPLQKTPQTLANLMSICKATELGRYSDLSPPPHSFISPFDTNSPFPQIELNLPLAHPAKFNLPFRKLLKTMTKLHNRHHYYSDMGFGMIHHPRVRLSDNSNNDVAVNVNLVESIQMEQSEKLSESVKRSVTSTDPSKSNDAGTGKAQSNPTSISGSIPNLTSSPKTQFSMPDHLHAQRADLNQSPLSTSVNLDTVFTLVYPFDLLNSSSSDSDTDSDDSNSETHSRMKISDERSDSDEYINDHDVSDLITDFQKLGEKEYERVEVPEFPMVGENLKDEIQPSSSSHPSSSKSPTIPATKSFNSNSLNDVSGIIEQAEAGIAASTMLLRKPSTQTPTKKDDWDFINRPVHQVGTYTESSSSSSSHLQQRIPIPLSLPNFQNLHSNLSNSLSSATNVVTKTGVNLVASLKDRVNVGVGGVNVDSVVKGVLSGWGSGSGSWSGSEGRSRSGSTTESVSGGASTKEKDRDKPRESGTGPSRERRPY